VQNLAHSASFHSKENNAPSKPGIKQLGPGLWPRETDLIDKKDPTILDAQYKPVERFDVTPQIDQMTAVVHDGQDAEAAAVGELVGHEVQAPALVG
jgi:hypothetical protein